MRVILTQEATVDFENLPRVIQARVIKVFERLECWPEVSGAKQLTGKWSGCWRIRTGDWRVVFEVQNDVIIIRIAHRKEVYDD
ncbi:MAG: type II toxin-antitoxin system RelE/ParE family toxin [Phycisphaeraceae bacterium JB051]